MSESPEVESNYANPEGKSNLEKGEKPETKKPSNPKMPPSGDLGHAGQSDNTARR
jgi:hypothetical protein